MKKMILSLSLMAFATFSFGQITAPETLQHATIAEQGIVLNVGNTTGNQLNGRNDFLVTTTGTNERTQLIVTPSGTGTRAFFAASNTSDIANGAFVKFGVRDEYAVLNYENDGTPAVPLKHFVIELDGKNDFADNLESFVVTSNGGINTGTAPTVLCTIGGTGLSTIEAKVQATVAAPDYVFKSDYNLRSLDDVEAYINENSHLPEIPSAAEFAKDGITLGKMSFDLLKKVEELTLYMIEMKKENKDLKKRVAELEASKK